MSQVAPIRRDAGFSLIELMIAMVIGLIVIGAVLALVMSMINTNNQTIQSTRLTQELRATTAVITSELQRVGSAENPFNLTTALALGAVGTSTPGCITYAYTYRGAADTEVAVNRAIYRNAGDKAVYVGGTSCGANGVKLSSTNVNLTAMSFVQNGRRINVTLTGSLPSNPAISRSYTQSVFVPGLNI